MFSRLISSSSRAIAHKNIVLHMRFGQLS
uniref:Uncharacterized protein n=1 Tax=Rhizophora mucronata TaxID=61149 RepID=A0A2P2N7W7_RHIMU